MTIQHVHCTLKKVQVLISNNFHSEIASKCELITKTASNSELNMKICILIIFSYKYSNNHFNYNFKKKFFYSQSIYSLL